MQIIPPDTKIDFMGQARLLTRVSAGLVLLSVVLMFVRGFNLGIDFKGGTVLQVQVPEEAGPVDEARIRSRRDLDRPGGNRDALDVLGRYAARPEHRSSERDDADSCDHSVNGSTASRYSRFVGEK